MGLRLKICGLMRHTDVSMCCRMGVSICGFVTEYPLEVPWNLSPEQCADLIRSVSPPTKSCVVTGGSREQISSLALALKPDLIQLHYRETLEDTSAVVRTLSPHGIGVIKTVPAAPEERLLQFGTENIRHCVRALCETGVYAILVDGRTPANAASGGVPADLSFYRQVKSAADRPVMLGGGITAENCRKIILEAQPEIIDVMTGVETAPGTKSKQMLAALLNQI